MLWLAAGVIAVSVLGAEADGKKALKSWGDFAVGGTWSATIDGDEKEHTYEWMKGENFLMLTRKEKENPGITIVGVDPETKKMKWWLFNEDGGVGSMTMSSPEDGVWSWTLETNGPEGVLVVKGRANRIDGNTLKGVTESTLDGLQQPTRKSTWIRK